jgi:hypothetical protein
MSKIKKYFLDLLATVKRIEKHLELLSGCVRKNHHSYGDRQSISTKGFND